MFSPLVRIILCTIGTILSWNFYQTGKIGSMIVMLLAILLIVLGYFRHGTVYAALQQIKKGNYSKAESLLLKIKKPDLLSISDKSYYHFIKGFIELSKDKLENSVTEFKTSMNIGGLRTENDYSIVTLNLAEIELNRENFNVAKEYISQTRGYKMKPDVETELERIEKEWSRAQENKLKV